MEVGLVRSIDIDREMQQAYLDYAMSVIVARALPDARDGLKPVHRRILYAMYDMNLGPDSAYKKSARIVGEVLGKYHPHGDIAVYESMARMAQDFSMRYLLVDGQGNFGSVDGDPPAAMRYTEARLTSPASQMLSDIDKNTVDFSDNFDGSLTEPVVLPAAIPNMLVNGATGIAVGMSTSIPPHNLAEVVDALIFMLHKWEELDDINVEDLMRFIQGPDFPTGGVIIQEPGEEEGLTSAYGSGRGKVVIQARAHFEEMSRGRNRIIVTELPYMTNKSSLIERIAELVRDGRMEGIADLRDESDRQGLRIVIELTKTADPETILNQLYKNTQMRSTFGIIMLALVDGEPRMLSLKQSLRVYLDHRLVVIRRRSEYELERARQRAHILEGLRIALKNLDTVIDLIRKAPDVETARARLMKRFRLSEIQAQAILDMPLRRLAALERKKIEDEYKETLGKIKALEVLLRSPKKMREVVADELRVVKDAYADRRRTQIINLGKRRRHETPILVTDLAPEREVWISVTPQGLISRTLDDHLPRYSGRDTPAHLIRVNTRDTLYLVTEQGEAAGVPVHAIPEAEEITSGIPLYKASALSETDVLAALFTLPPKDERADGWFVFTSTQQGQVKKTALSELPGPTARTFVLVKVNEGDRLGWVRLTNGKADILLATEAGMAIRFSEEEVRPMGLVAAGVGGIKLQARDEVVGMELVPPRGEILFLASDGRGKRIPAAQFPVQGRYGQGVVAWKLPRTARLVSIATGKETSHLIVLPDKLAPKSIRLNETALQTRSAHGKPVIAIKSGDQVISLVIPFDAPRPTIKEKSGSRAAVVLSGDVKEAEILIQKSVPKPRPAVIAVPAPRKRSSARKPVKEVKPVVKPQKSRAMDNALSGDKVITGPEKSKPATKPLTKGKVTSKPQKSKATAKPLTKGKVTSKPQKSKATAKPLPKEAVKTKPPKSKTSQKPAPEKLPRRRKPKARLAASMASHKPPSSSQDLTAKGTTRSASTKKPATKTTADKKSSSTSTKVTTPGKPKPKAGTRTKENSPTRKDVKKQKPPPT